MFQPHAPRLWPAALLLLSLSAGATPPAPTQRPAKADPLDAASAVPPLTYRSVFAPYRGQRELPLRSWKEANDEVARIGGWRVYAREAALPDTPSTAPTRPVVPGSTPAAQPVPQGAGGHRHH